MSPFKAPRKAFTLVEVMIVVFIVMVASLAIMGGLYFVNGAQRYARERTHAQQIAANIIEQARQTAFKNLVAIPNQTVTIDDNGTPSNTSDDLMGQSSLLLYAYPGGAANQISNTIGQEYVIAEATVTWYTPGANQTSASLRRVTLVTQIAP